MVDDNSNKSPKAGFLSDASRAAIEKVFVYIMYTAIVGSAVYFFTSLQSIEKTIAQHHGHNWAEVNSIVEISQIQNNVKNVKDDLRSNQSRVDVKFEQINSQIEIISMWIQHNDKIMSDANKSIYSANALYDDFGGQEALCKVNIAHIHGPNFKIGDIVLIKNEDSRVKASTNCTIDSTINDRSEASVLYSLNSYVAKKLNFTKAIGRISISTNLVDIPEDRRWKTLDEFKIAH
jgi:hypothetical protein